MESLFTATTGIASHFDGDCKSRALKFYNEVYMKMNKEQKNVYIIVCDGFFCGAMEAYNYATKAVGFDRGLTDGQRIFQVGINADAALSAFRKLQNMWGLDVDKTCDKITEVDKWIVRSGSHSHICRPVDSNGVEHVKTVREIWNDMVRFEKTRTEFRKSMEAKAKADNERR